MARLWPDRSALDLLRKLARYLGKAWDPQWEAEDACDELKPLLQGRRMLIVLDDVWDYRRQAKPLKELICSSGEPKASCY